MIARRPGSSAVAPLLYWLLVLSALEAVTVLRGEVGAQRDLVALWAGTILGVALGQTLAWARVRAWVLGAFAVTGFWLVPFAFLILWEIFGAATTTALLAFVPATLGGYLALSERGGLAAFWYPTVLWMLVLFDGAKSFDGRGAAPYLLALAALFVAFLHAREMRRAALWQTFANVRLATPLSRTVLRRSPLRSASQVAWTGLVGAAALALVMLIAPRLWQERHLLPPAALSTDQTRPATAAAGPCCPPVASTRGHRVVVREYLPLHHGHDEPLRENSNAGCVACDGAARVLDSDEAPSAYGVSGPAYGDGAGSPAYGVVGSAPANGVNAAYATIPADPAAAPGPAPSAMPAASAATPIVAPPRPTAQPTGSAAAAPGPMASPEAPSASPPPPPAAVAPEKAEPHEHARVPWAGALGLLGALVFLRLAARALRRALTVRHLSRPFWTETLDQRISNHWQRLLIGLRDAGVHPARDEQPMAFARRVGLEPMATCATILERVRHGVRVGPTDLATMDRAATATYRAARRSAGIAGRAAGWLRWPLA